MKTISEILENYSEYEVFMNDRFGIRFAQFLTAEQIKQIGFELNNPDKHQPEEFTEEAVIAQLARDLEFGAEKGFDQRGISASLMFDTCQSWMKVLEIDLYDLPDYGEGYEEGDFGDTYGGYGLAGFAWMGRQVGIVPNEGSYLNDAYNAFK